jgi:hypothetical protein
VLRFHVKEMMTMMAMMGKTGQTGQIGLQGILGWDAKIESDKKLSRVTLV